MMRQAAFFSDNNFQDYEFTRLNTYEKKEMSEELTIILSNNYYWNQPLARRSQFLAIIGNYCPKKQAACGEEKRHICVRKTHDKTEHLCPSVQSVGRKKNSRNLNYFNYGNLFLKSHGI